MRSRNDCNACCRSDRARPHQPDPPKPGPLGPHRTALPAHHHAAARRRPAQPAPPCLANLTRPDQPAPQHRRPARPGRPGRPGRHPAQPSQPSQPSTPPSPRPARLHALPRLASRHAQPGRSRLTRAEGHGSSRGALHRGAAAALLFSVYPQLIFAFCFVLVLLGALMSKEKLEQALGKVFGPAVEAPELRSTASLAPYARNSRTHSSGLSPIPSPRHAQAAPRPA